MDVNSAFMRQTLDGAEPRRELGVGAVECERRMHCDLAAEVHHREEQVAELRFECLPPAFTARGRGGSAIRTTLAGRGDIDGDVPGRAVELFPDLLELLVDLFQRAVVVRPVESHSRGAVLEPEGAVQPRQTHGQAVDDRFALLRLHLLPRPPLTALVEMRMASLHLRDEPIDDIMEVEGSPLLGDDRVEEDLQEEIAQLLAQQCVVGGAYRLLDLVSLLQQVRTEGLVGLRRVPLATAAEVAHQRECVVEGGLFLLRHDRPGYTIRSTVASPMDSLHARAWVEVDLGALRRNGEAIRSRSGRPILPMIKADAYGLGAIPVARALEEIDPWGYGVATVDEGLHLRDSGISRPIIVFTPVLPEELDQVRRAGLRPALGSAGTIEQWGWLGDPWHLSIDTGMSRAGVHWRDVEQVVESVGKYPPEGAFTHLHSAESDGSVEEQLARFDEALSKLPARPPLLHAESGAALARRGESRFDIVRPGIFLYGWGGMTDAPLQPEPVVSVRARVVDLRWIEEGESVSYEATWRAPARRRIATLPVGYADGIRRSLSGSGFVSIRGSRAPIAGLVTMDMVMVDVTAIECEIGDVATLLGTGDGLDVTLRDWADASGLSPYEILAGLRLRLHRLYRDDR
jgi:alanine racemase